MFVLLIQHAYLGEGLNRKPNELVFDTINTLLGRCTEEFAAKLLEC